jgi:hypothetical protein
MRSILNIIHLILLALFVSCNYADNNYPRITEIQNENGLPKDSLAFYFSTFEPVDSTQIEFVKDTFWQTYLSTNLYAFKEPILFNNYLGHDIYRFLWLRSFHLPMIFSLSDSKGIVTLRTKKLDRQPLYKDYGYSPDDPAKDSMYMKLGYKIRKEIDTLDNGKTDAFTVVKADRIGYIIHDSTINLSETDWSRIKKLLEEIKFWSLTPYYWAGHTDGATWIIEAHTKNKYRYIVRQSPNGKLRELGELFVELSGLKEEIY